jgi:hypothetical protein
VLRSHQAHFRQLASRWFMPIEIGLQHFSGGFLPGRQSWSTPIGLESSLRLSANSVKPLTVRWQPRTGTAGREV